VSHLGQDLREGDPWSRGRGVASHERHVGVGARTVSREVQQRHIRPTAEQRIEIVEQCIPRDASGHAGALLTVEVGTVVVVPPEQWLERVDVIHTAVQGSEAVVLVDADQ
jgi:hypothetical protein